MFQIKVDPNTILDNWKIFSKMTYPVIQEADINSVYTKEVIVELTTLNSYFIVQCP